MTRKHILKVSEMKLNNRQAATHMAYRGYYLVPARGQYYKLTENSR